MLPLPFFFRHDVFAIFDDAAASFSMMLAAYFIAMRLRAACLMRAISIIFAIFAMPTPITLLTFCRLRRRAFFATCLLMRSDMRAARMRASSGAI